MMMIVADAAAAAVVMSKVNEKDWSSGSRRRHYGIMGRQLFRNVPRYIYRHVALLGSRVWLNGAETGLKFSSIHEPILSDS
jgi:hypothetical protein